MSVKNEIQKLNYKYEGIMNSSLHSIPFGNGVLGANIWIEKDAVAILLSKDGNWSEQNRLLKTGLIKIKLNPNPFDEDTVTALDLYTGTISIKNSKNNSELKIYCCFDHPLYNIEFSSNNSVKLTVEIINYRSDIVHLDNDDRSNFHMLHMEAEMIESADICYINNENSIGQYHRNNHSCYNFTMEKQGIDKFPDRKDPLIGLTFGFLVYCENMRAVNSNILETKGNVTSANIRVFSHTCYCTDFEKWLYEIDNICTNYKTQSNQHLYLKHIKYWEENWQRSYIFLWGSKKAEAITKGYVYQRYMNLCACFGEYPIKFNGSIFTMEPTVVNGKENFDFRMWGAPYWLQNTRLIYWNLLYAGDVDAMMPFFNLYLNNLPLAEYRTREYFNHEGAYFPETMSFFGTHAGLDFQGDRTNAAKGHISNNYTRWYYSGALEVALMMCEYYKKTKNINFFKEYITPFAKAVLTFYLQHFEILDGKMLIKPTASLETWHDCVNDTPTIAGLKTVAEILHKHEQSDENLIAICKEILEKVPDIPLWNKGGKVSIAPFEINIDNIKRNCENPELYAVFPYKMFTFYKGNCDYAKNAYDLRLERDLPGWAQDAIQSAILGLSGESLDMIYKRFTSKNPKCSFPAFWGPNFDYTPDQDHGAVASIALINVLLQSENEEKYILPNWDEKINVWFRLPLENGKYLNVKCVDGRVEILNY